MTVIGAPKPVEGKDDTGDIPPPFSLSAAAPMPASALDDFLSKGAEKGGAYPPGTPNWDPSQAPDPVWTTKVKFS